ncbi:MAG TPA: S8 family peptidase, partial [Lacipirellulaceae bacterium]|nr:S8 family peptidase [Lacipirellulaceae bacterium]
MARSIGGVGSWWLRLLKPGSVQKRLIRSRQRVSQRACTYAAQLRGCELLEDRTLLALDTTAVWADFSTLQYDPDDYDPAHVLVRFDDGVASPADYLQTLSSSVRGAEIAATLPLVPGLQRVRLTGGLTLDAALAALRGDPHVLYAEPDYRVRIAGLSTDPRFSEQWDFHNAGQSGGTIDADIDAPEAWDVTTGTGRTLVAVIDTGVDYRHPDLAANIWVNADELPGNNIDDDNNGYVDDVHGYDFYNNDGNPLDDHNHGTHVAGTIGAVGNNGSGVAGVNWDVQIMALKFLGSDGSGTTSDAIEAVRYAVANGAQISNNSWGGDPFSQSLFDAIREARDAGHVFVAAAGNGDFLGF